MNIILVLPYWLLIVSVFYETGCNDSVNHSKQTSVCDTVFDKSKLRGTDFRLFYGTPLCELVPVLSGTTDTALLRELVVKNKLDLNYQEPKFGETVLMQAVLNSKYSVTKKLLELGADPNIHDYSMGESAVIIAASLSEKNDSAMFLKLLLAYGADPNDTVTGKLLEGNTIRNTPLLMACSSRNLYTNSSLLLQVKLLVEAGANVNYKDEFGNTPLKGAVVTDCFDVALYLLQNGAQYKELIFSYNGKDRYINDVLRESVFPLDSPEYAQKMALVDFLEKKGVSYKNTPIPEWTVEKIKKEHPNDWEEFIKKY